MGNGGLKEFFIENERILCYHGDLLYEAKCLGSKIRAGELVYRIHYIGWSKNWDTWAKHSQILKSTQANLQLKDDLMAKHNIHAVGRDRKTKIVKKRKRKLEVAKSSEDFTASDTETNENSEKPEEMPKKEEFCLPDTLVELLREDEKRILSENQTSIKEHQLNVKYVFDLFEYELYLNPSKESSSALVNYEQSQTEEFKNGMLLYFDALMPIYLLYDEESYQPSINAPHKTCTIVHLLRFLVKLPEFISPLLDEPEMSRILTPFVTKFIDWLGHKVTELRLAEFWDEFYQ